MRASLVSAVAVLGIVLLPLILTGCPAGSWGGVSREQQDKIAKGKTTKVDLLRELGTPDQTIDLGNGKEELSYVREEYTTNGFTTNSKNTEFWLMLDKGVVQDFGERPTTKSHKYGGM